MKLLAVFLLLTFTGLALFGVFGMHTSGQKHDHGCLAAVAQGTACPEQIDVFEYLSFHLTAFRSFSTVVFGSLILVLTLFALGVGLVTGRRNYLTSPPLNLVYRRFGSEQFSSPSKQQFLRWLALHENSPAIF